MSNLVNRVIFYSGENSNDISGNLTLSGNTINLGGTRMQRDASSGAIQILDASGNAQGAILNSLDVSNNVTIKGNLDVSNNVTIKGTLDVSNNVTIKGTLDVSNNFFIRGNVGIGITAPLARLDVSGSILISNNSNYQVRKANNSVSNLINIATDNSVRFYGQGGTLHINPDLNISDTRINQGNTANITMYNGGNVRLLINSTGVGINKTPSTNLDVSGNMILSGNLTLNTNQSTLNASNPQLKTTGYDYVIYDVTGLNTLKMTTGILASGVSHSNNEPSVFIPRKLTSTSASQYISIPNGNPAAINDIFINDMTIEAFVYVLEQPNYNGEYSALVGYMSPTANTGVWSFGIWINTVSFTYNSNLGFNRLNCSTTININTWYHIAVVYSKTTNTFSMYVNGTIQAMNAPIGIGGGSTAGATSHTVQGTSLQTQTNDLIIGQFQGQSLYCYVSNLRIVSGSGGNITPSATPTAPLTVVANTKLLLRASINSATLANFTNYRSAFGTTNPIAPFQIADNPSSAVGTNVPFIGYRGNNNNLMVVSTCGMEYLDATNTTTITIYLPNALTATNFSPGGNAFSVYVGNRTTTLNNTYYNQVAFTSNFTIDAFVYYTETPINALNNVPYLMCLGDSGGPAFRWGFGMNNNSKLAFAYKDTSAVTTVVETVNTMSLNTWYHVAVTHNTTTKTLILYINGTAQTLTAGGSSYSTTSATMNDIGYNALIGCYGGQYNKVFISDLRVITNVTTPPALPLPPQTAVSGTSLLFRARATSDGANLLTVLKNGNVGIGSSVPSQLLDVSGNVSVNGNTSFVGNMNVGGNVGIGTNIAMGILGIGSNGAAFPTPSGNAPLYACRAWVNFGVSGTTVTIYGSGNISSIVRNNTGDYTINFTTAMPTASFAAVAGYQTGNGRWMWLYNGTYNTSSRAGVTTASSVRYYYADYSATPVPADPATACVIVIC